MRRSIVTILLGLLAPLGAQALEVLDLSRGVRLVDPSTLFDERSNATGNFDRNRLSSGNLSSQRSQIVATPTSIALDTGSPASFRTVVSTDFAIAETWLRMNFRTDGPSMSTLASFSASQRNFGPNPPRGSFDLHMSLRDLTAGTTVFEFVRADFGPAASWSGSLVAAHLYAFDFSVLADAPLEQVAATLNLDITAQPVPEPAAATLMLLGLALAAGAAHRRAAARSSDRLHLNQPQ